MVSSCSWNPTWDQIAPYMQTELARLSIFMSLVGYMVVFSDLLFVDGVPSFSGLLASSSTEEPSANYFMLEAETKWRLTYFAFFSLFIARLWFNFCCPKRLKRGFVKSDYVQSIQSLPIKSDIDSMFSRVAPKQRADQEDYSFEEQRQELIGLLFPNYDIWQKAVREVNLQNAWKGDRVEKSSKDEAKDVQHAELGVFFTDCLAKDFELAIYERRGHRFAVGVLGGCGYVLLTIPAFDLLQTVLRVTFFP